MFPRQGIHLFCDGLVRQRIWTAWSSTHIHTVRSFCSSMPLLKITMRPRGRQIAAKFPTVQLINEENKICPPEPIEDILKRVERESHFVELVQDDPPLVKVKDREVDRAARKAAKTKARETRMDRKEIQLTWNVSDSDLDHKITKARNQLERNNLVDIAFAPKAKQRLPPEQTMIEKMQKVVDALEHIALERQERTFERGVGIIFLRPNKLELEQNE